MSKDLFLDPLTNDLYIEGGKLSLTNSVQNAIRQRISIYLSTFRGEMFWNTSAGIPYLENDNNPIQLLGKSDKRFFDVLIREAILSREGVVSLSKYDSKVDLNSRTISISFVAVTEDGDMFSADAIDIQV